MAIAGLIDIIVGLRSQRRACDTEPAMSQVDTAPFVAYPSRWRRILLALLSWGFVALGLWMVGAFGEVPTSRRYPYWETMIAGWFCLIFSGLAAAAWVPKIFENGEQLRVDRLGIRYSQWSDETIPWSEIADVTTWAYRSQRGIVLHLRHPERFPGRGIALLFAGANRWMTGGHISVSMTGTDRSFDEAMSQIEHFRSPDETGSSG